LHVKGEAQGVASLLGGAGFYQLHKLRVGGLHVARWDFTGCGCRGFVTGPL